jgi:4-amino-4-deoxy-L-arabinose transferase-like glycosyltransferase
LNSSKNNINPTIYWIVSISLLVKLVLLPFSQTVNADAISRVFASISWMEDPGWISKSIWAPFHFYIHGVGLMIWNNPIYMPKIITIIFSVLTLFPFYFFTKREFNNYGALVATFFLALSPVLFRNSFMPLSETPYLFFLALTINLFSKSIKENSTKYILLAGITITFAAGIRYEAWVIIPILSLLIFLLKKWKFIFLFNITALLFPLYWLLSNWIETGDPLYSIQGTYNWSLNVMDRNENMDFESYLRRLWFFPFSWIIAIGIPACYIILGIVIKKIKDKSKKDRFIFFSIPFVIMFFFYEYNSFKGVLLTQHRYIGTLVILSLPFISIHFNEINSKKIKQSLVFGLTTILLSFVYNTSGVIPLPRLGDQTNVIISQVIKENSTNESCLILDFIGWDNTYYISLHSGLKQKNIVITEGAKNSKLPLQDIKNKLEEYEKGIILLKKESELFNLLSPSSSFYNDNKKLQLEKIYQSKENVLFLWEKQKP